MSSNPVSDKTKSNSTKQKLQSGTIFKDVSYVFSPADLEFLWESHNDVLKKFEQPKEKYTRHLSDLIRQLRDISSKLIQAGAIPNFELADTAIYVRKQLKERGVPLDTNFNKYFLPELKREWQTDEPKKYNSKHTHDWLDICDTQLGIMKKCRGSSDSLCGAIMIDGKVYEYTPEDIPDPDTPTKKKKIPLINPKIMFAVESFQRAGNNMYDFAGRLKSHSHLLTDDEIKVMDESVFLMNKAGDFLKKTALNKKQIIDPYTMHLLERAYCQETQNVAGGLFIKYRLDLAERKHSKGVKFFKQIGEFAKLISEKQTKKSMEAKIKEINERYQPTSEDDAMDCGFSGQQCENCENRRIGYRSFPNTNYVKDRDPIHMKSTLILQCYDCDHIPKRKIYKLPKETPLVQVQWTTS